MYGASLVFYCLVRCGMNEAEGVCGKIRFLVGMFGVSLWAVSYVAELHRR